MLPDGADAPVQLPFGPLIQSQDLAVGSYGSVYVAVNAPSPRVLMLEPGAEAPVELPFPDLARTESLAVDHWGTVYVAAGGRVSAWRSGVATGRDWAGLGRVIRLLPY